MKYLFIISAVFSALFFLILLTNKGKRFAHRFLTMIFFLLIISCTFVFVSFNAETEYYVPLFSELNYAIPMLYGVLLWFYSRSLTQKAFRFRLADLLHFVPFLVFLFFLFGLSMHSPAILLDNLGFPVPKLITNFAYILATIILLERYKADLLERVSHVDSMYLFWLRWIAYGALILLLVAVLGNIFNLFKPSSNTLEGDYFLISVLAIYLFVLGYIGFNKTEIFQSIRDTEINDKKKIEQEISPNDVLIDQEAFYKLDKIMRTEKPFLDPQLSLADLAALTKTNSGRLSYLINNLGDQNFYDFVNTYRVHEVKDCMESDKYHNLTLLAIAFECGFNSKATFNRIFKKQTGITPSAYQKEVSTSL